MNGTLVSVSNAASATLFTAANASAINASKIRVLGWSAEQSASRFSVSFNPEASPPGAFSIGGLPLNDLVSLELQSTVADTTISFPILVAGGRTILLPALPAGTWAQVKAEATRVPGGVFAGGGYIDESIKGNLLGALAPAGGGCAPAVGIDIVAKADGRSVLDGASNGPFYVNTSNQIVNTGRFSDAECSYIVFNLIPGAYRFRVLGVNPAREAEFTAVAGKVAVGSGFPDAQQ
jgi:hypothetical protein